MHEKIESNVTPGIYEHYKGGQYEVTGIALNEFEEAVVMYTALYDNPLSKYWTRTLATFEEPVEVEGKTVPRFRRVS
ncbi:MAG TPA: DUF1653 domain-containing protein [Patescibacteria group bacterium]|jgi:hypothetical protein|nr:DUF1653 domain-containing protein [Patescibacteria group bacterium]